MTTSTSPSYRNLRIEHRGPVTVLFVNRPGVLNAIDRTTLTEIEDAVGRFVADDAQGALILTDKPESPPGYLRMGSALMDLWSTKANMPTARALLAAAFLDGKLYALGGFNDSYSSANEQYSPFSNSWAQMAPMPTPRANFAAVVVGDKIFAIGGENSTGAITAIEAYSPATNTWTTLAPMPTARRDFAAAAVNNRIFVVGGRDGSGSPLDTNEVYDATNDSWAAAAPLPSPRSGLSAAVVDNILYAIGGMRDSGARKSAANEAYDPAANAWTAKAPLPVSVNNPAVAAVNGFIYAIGPLVNLEYSPAGNTWAVRSPSVGGREQYAAAGGALIYLVGGLDDTYSSTTEAYYMKLYHIHQKY